MRYFGSWSDKDDVECNFETTIGDVNILFAIYDTEDYEGYAFVLFYGEDNELYEVNGSHCSCYELEEQWEPEKTDWTAIRHRFEHGQLFPLGDMDDGALKQIKYLLNNAEILDA
jgi:hypothetical protein